MNREQVTPYDTGKVKIGLLYNVQPLCDAPMDGDFDAEYLQAALLRKNQSTWMDKAREIARRIVGA